MNKINGSNLNKLKRNLINLFSSLKILAGKFGTDTIFSEIYKEALMKKEVDIYDFLDKESADSSFKDRFFINIYLEFKERIHEEKSYLTRQDIDKILEEANKMEDSIYYRFGLVFSVTFLIEEMIKLIHSKFPKMRSPFFFIKNTPDLNSLFYQYLIDEHKMRDSLQEADNILKKRSRTSQEFELAEKNIEESLRMDPYNLFALSLKKKLSGK